MMYFIENMKNTVNILTIHHILAFRKSFPKSAFDLKISKT